MMGGGECEKNHESNYGVWWWIVIMVIGVSIVIKVIHGIITTTAKSRARVSQATQWPVPPLFLSTNRLSDRKKKKLHRKSFMTFSSTQESASSFFSVLTPEEEKNKRMLCLIKSQRPAPPPSSPAKTYLLKEECDGRVPSPGRADGAVSLQGPQQLRLFVEEGHQRPPPVLARERGRYLSHLPPPPALQAGVELRHGHRATPPLRGSRR